MGAWGFIAAAALLSWTSLAQADPVVTEQAGSEQVATGHAATDHARGLLALGAGRYDAARTHFDAALAANPTLTDARYHRGLAHGHLGLWDAAAADLEVVVREDPAREEAPLELGFALLQLDRCPQASEWLRTAGQVPALAARARLYEGVCALREGRSGDAIDLLESLTVENQTEHEADLRGAADFYLGVAYLYAGRRDEALRRFERVVRNDAGGELAVEAADYLRELRPEADRKTYWLHTEVGFAYDSNVGIGPDDETLDVSDAGDGRAELVAGIGFAPYLTDGAWLAVQYEVSQTLHFVETDFDLQHHRPEIGGGLRFGPWSLGATVGYHYYRADLDAFLQEVDVLPWVGFDAGSLGVSEATYRYRRRDYEQSVVGDLLDGDNHELGFGHRVPLGSSGLQALVGYRYDREDTSRAKNDAFAYTGHEAAGGLSARLPWQIDGLLEYTYRDEDYHVDSEGRRDREHRVLVEFVRSLGSAGALTLAYDGSVHDSTKPLFEYRRHIVSVSWSIEL